MKDAAYQKALQLIKKAAKTKATILILSSLGLTKLPPEIGQLKALKQLNIFDNQLSALPLEILQLQSLIKLNLGFNQFSTFPLEIRQLKALQELELYGNKITSLPPEIGQLKTLQILYLGGNQLSALPSEIGQLQALQNLNLPGNQLSALPPEIGQLQALKELNLGYNQFSAFPPEIGQLQNLKVLDLSGNKDSVLSPDIVKLQTLQKLALRDNQLSALPPEIRQLKTLQTLDISYNKFSALPPEIGQLKDLQYLDLSFNQLSSLPPEIGQLKALQDLDLSFNQLSGLPPEIGQLLTLQELNISDNQLSALPPEIGQLLTLQELKLNSNQLSALPPEIGQLNTLQTLDISSNNLNVLPPEIGQLEALRKLDLSFNQLSGLPPEIGQLKALQKLGLFENKLTSLLPEIGQLKALEKLNLSFNQLNALPPGIKKLEGMRKLYLGNNRLSGLPPEIGQLLSLQELNLNNNQLSALPPEIGQLKALQELGLFENKLTSLPPEIGQLKHLNTVDLRHNKLSSLPPDISQLQALQILYLGSNQLKTLPPEIGSLNVKLLWQNDNIMPENHGIYLMSNPLEIPPVEVVQQGREAVNVYFEAIEKEETTRLFEAKLLLVGQWGVGKTCLMNRLVHDAIDPKTISTEGIGINKWIIRTKQTDNFRINVWDFGGQEIYHATHRFFITKRSLYLFVWEARTDADSFFEYWLNTIKLYRNESPVIVIQNRIDKHKKLINQECWKKRFPNIVGFYDVSAEQRIGTDKLREAIIKEIEKLPHIGDLLPKRWTDIRKKLENLDKNYITYPEYQGICRKFGMDEAQTDRLSDYYHLSGVFMHYKDNPVLKNTVFLKPEWALNAVYKIVDNKKVKEVFGKFDFCDLGDIWTDRTIFPEDKYVDLIELMKIFELCFEHPVGKKYIIPELLQANQPEFDWDYEDNLEFKYQSYFMPAGIISRFIAITHDLIKDDLYWKDGVVLRWDNSEALIIKTDNRVIDIWTRGNNKKVLLDIIQRHLAYINWPDSQEP